MEVPGNLDDSCFRVSVRWEGAKERVRREGIKRVHVDDPFEMLV